MNNNKEIAVVILNWNGRKHLQQFLPSVLQHTPSELAEIIVADNASTDDSLAFLQENYPTIERIVLDKNYGFAEGYNRALAKLQHKYLILLNSDVEVTANWIEPLYHYLEANPNTAACQPKIKAYYRKTHFEHAGAAGGFIDCYGYPYCRGRILHEVEADTQQYDSVQSIFWATGAALFIRNQAFNEVGKLDGRFFAHMEEIDLCWRLKSRGYDIVCIPQSTVYHLGGGTLQTSSPFKTYLNFRNNLLMLYKNLSDAELVKVMRIRRLLDYVAALQMVLKGDLKNAQAVRRARKDYYKMRTEMQKDRTENLAQCTTVSIREKSKVSILYRYYLLGLHTFAQIQQKYNDEL